MVSPPSNQTDDGSSIAERTNDLLYESKDSREMLKGSLSERALRVLVELLEPVDLLDQKALRSGGDG